MIIYHLIIKEHTLNSFSLSMYFKHKYLSTRGLSVHTLHWKVKGPHGNAMQLLLLNGWCVVVLFGGHLSGLLVPWIWKRTLPSRTVLLNTSPFPRTAVSSWRNDWQFVRAVGIWFIKEPSRNEAKSGVFNHVRTPVCSILGARDICSMLRVGFYLQRCGSELSTLCSVQSCNLYSFHQ